MQAWVFRRGEWELLDAARQAPPHGLRLARTPQMLTPDGSVNLFVGLDDAPFPYVIALRLGDSETGRQEWICVPDLPSLVELMQQLGPWLRNEVAIQSFLNSILDERLGPPPDSPRITTGNARDLTAMNQALFDSASITRELDRTLQSVCSSVSEAGVSLDRMVHHLTTRRNQIASDDDANATRLDAVLTLLQSASLLLQSGEHDGAVEEVRKALAAWKLDENGSLLP